MAGCCFQLTKPLCRNGHQRGWLTRLSSLALMIAFYFVTSISLTFYQKHLISEFPIPMSIVVVHLVIKFCLAHLCRCVLKCWTQKSRTLIEWSKYLPSVGLVAVFSALDIGLSQWSFDFISISLYTMVKTTSIVFILMFAIWLKLEDKHWSQIVIVLLISVGLSLFTYRSTNFDWRGFVLAFTASFLSGARWTFSQKVLQKSKLNLQNPIDFIYHIQPLMILTLLPISVAVEGDKILASQYGFRMHHISEAVTNFARVGVGGFMAFSMEVAEFLIVSHASSLTLFIIGGVKEVTILTMSIVVNGNYVSPVNVVGIIICLAGLAAHIWRKAITLTEESAIKDRSGNVGDILLQESDSDDERYEVNISRDPRKANRLLSLEARAKTRCTNSQSKRKDAASSVPLLHDQSSDEEGGTFRSTEDSFFFQDNRQWTSVRDAHLQMETYHQPTSLVSD